jgi:hypothetical protein
MARVIQVCRDLGEESGVHTFDIGPSEAQLFKRVVVKSQARGKPERQQVARVVHTAPEQTAVWPFGP